MKKLVIYPFTIENSVFLKYRHALSEYKLHKIISEKNKLYEKFKEEETVAAISELEQTIQDSEVILLLTGNESNERYKEIIQLAIQNKKQVIAVPEVREIFINEFPNIKTISGSVVSEDIKEFNKYDDLEVPIISIMSLGENAQKLDLQLSISSYFEEKGYQLLNICSNSLCEFFGLNSMPDFMFSNNISMPKKVQLFQWYIKKTIQESSKTYDLITISIPGGSLPINKYETNYYGELAYVVSRAISADINILNVYFQDNINQEYINALIRHHNEVFNCNTDYINMSCTCADFDRYTKSMRYYNYSREVIANKISELKQSNLFCGFYNINCKSVFQNMENILSNSYDII